MRIPENTQLYETPISTLWFDENGILCANSKEIERIMDYYKEQMELYKTLTKDGNKLLLLIDTTKNSPVSEEIRKYLISEMPKYVKAHAILSSQPLGSTLNNTFINLSFSGFPLKIFYNVDEAKEWLKEYL